MHPFLTGLTDGLLILAGIGAFLGTIRMLDAIHARLAR